MSNGYNSSIRAYLRQIDQHTKALLDERLSPYDITPQQARIVGFTNYKQNQGETICQKDIEEVFKLKGSSITSLLQGLERRGFIERRADPADERRKIVSLLPKGRDLASDFEDAFHEIDNKLLHNLTSEQLETLTQLLKIMAKNVE